MLTICVAYCVVCNGSYGIVTDQIDPTAASPSVVFGVVVLVVAIMGMYVDTH